MTFGNIEDEDYEPPERPASDMTNDEIVAEARQRVGAGEDRAEVEAAVERLEGAVAAHEQVVAKYSDQSKQYAVSLHTVWNPAAPQDTLMLSDLRTVLDALGRLERERVEEAEPRPGHGPGVPGAMHLEAFGQAIADAFGECPYHVGSSATSKVWRDVDVRLILDDEKFHALFPGFAKANHIDAWWSLLCAALSELGRVRTGLPIDFQIQSMTEANEKYDGIRNPLMLFRADEARPPVMLAAQDRPPCGDVFRRYDGPTYTCVLARGHDPAQKHQGDGYRWPADHNYAAPVREEPAHDG